MWTARRTAIIQGRLVGAAATEAGLAAAVKPTKVGA
jgi:hypothetical protein